MDTLKILSEKEAQLLRMVVAQTGTMEEKVGSLEGLGVFDAYQEILRAYLALIAEPAVGVEALKRAVFLAWYGSVEPSCFSGLRVPKGYREAAFHALGRAFEEGTADSELRWMVSWYHRIADFLFPNLEPYPHLRAHLADVGTGVDELPEEVRCGLGERGQMSDYWLSITDAKVSRSKW